MAIIYRRNRNPQLVAAGKKAARGETNTYNCPKCGNMSTMTEKYKDRATYKCDACGELATYTIDPGDVKKLHRTPKSPTGIIVRDKSKEKDATLVDTTQIEEIKGDVEGNLNIIRDGMEKRSNLMFEYKGKDGGKTLRDVEPYKLFRNKKGELVLYAYCIAGKGIRIFKLNSIKSIEVSQTEFKPRWVLEDKIKK